MHLCLTRRMSTLSEPSPGIGHPIDRVCDLTVWTLGIWTVVYHVGLTVHLPTDAMLAVTAVLTGVTFLVLRRGGAGPAGAPPLWSWEGGRLPVLVTVVVAAVAALVLSATGSYTLGWALCALALVPLLYIALHERREARDPEADGSTARPAWQSWLMAGGATLTGIVAMFTYRSDPDDAFYVNKAVFVAQHGFAPSRDTMYSDQVLPAIRGAGTVPVQSIEVLQGAVAHLLHLDAGTVVYLLTPLLGGFLAVWTLWRLLRMWTGPRALLGVAVALGYYLFGGRSGYTFGVFFIGRIWQGKVLFVAILVPLAYVYLTRWARRRHPGDAWLLLATGAAAVGLTSSATFIVPIIAAAISVALLVTRRPGALGVLSLAAYPIGSGLVVATLTSSETLGTYVFTSDQAVDKVFAGGFWTVVTILVILISAWFVSRGPARVVVTAAVVAEVIVMAPRFPELVNAGTQAGPVLWRLLWVAPVPALLGTLAAATTGRSVPHLTRQVLAAALPAVLVLGVVGGGHLIYSERRSTRLSDQPLWKFSPTGLRQAGAIAKGYHGSGPVLAPSTAMRALALTTTEIFAVDPRAFYLPSLEEPAKQHAARRRLSALMARAHPAAPPSLARDLNTLHVGLACVADTQHALDTELERLGWSVSLTPPGLTCRVPPGG